LGLLQHHFGSALSWVIPFDPDGDPEILHRHRVAMRKIRSLIGLLPGVFPQPISEELKTALSDIARRDNRQRDFDVRKPARPRLAVLVPEDLRPGLGAIWAALDLEHGEVARDLAAYFASKPFHETVAAIHRILAPGRTFGASPDEKVALGTLVLRALKKRYRKFLRAGEAIDSDSDAETLHRLRIHGKKMRYLLDFMPSEVPQAYLSPMAQALKRLQGKLGEYNDGALLEADLVRRGLALGGTEDIRTPLAMGALIGIVRGQNGKHREAVEACMGDFRNEAVRSSLAALRKWGRKQRLKHGPLPGAGEAP
jgi:CHAD domain-containing protein